MRSRTIFRLPAAGRRLHRLAVTLALVTLVAQGLLAVPLAQAAVVYPNPPAATPVAWPSSFTSYTTDTGAPISDVEGEAGVGSVFDISSSGGAATSVFLALSGNAAFFRARVGSNPVDTAKGGFTNATWLVLIGTEDSPGVWTTKAVTGVDGKPVGSAAAPDTVYVGNAPGTGITDVYQFNTVAPAFDPTNAVGTGVRVVAAGGGQYFIDWQVPVSTLATASGGAVTASTPVRLFFGSSAAANLATINKDYMTGGAVSFANLGTVTLSPPTLALTESKALVSGPNPPQAGSTSTYDITVTAQNTGGSSLFSPSISVVIPAGATLVSQSSATGSIGAVGQTVTWTPGTMLGGAAAVSATIRVSVTPTSGDVGSTLTLANAASGSGSDGVATITGTGATAQTAGPVADSPHATTTGVSCPAGPIAYGSSVSCTVTVTDTTGAGATVPTGAVTMTGTLGTSTACTLAAAASSGATCTVTFTATGVGSASLGADYAGDATHVASGGTSGTVTTTKKTLTVTVDPATKVYGAANPGFTVGYAGFVPGDSSASLGGTLAFSTAATSPSPAGSYAVSASGLVSANYAFSYVDGTLSVTQASLTITADPASRAYGAANPALSASYAGFVNGDDPSDLTTPAVVSTTATAGSPAGTYPITVSGATSANYAITFTPGTLTVGTAALTVTADSVSRPYGQANPGFTAAIAGFQGTDGVGDLGGILTCSSAATASSPVGTYPITCSGLTSGNYAIGYVAGTLTVSPVSLTVTPDPQTRIYGAANPTLSATITGFVNGDPSSVVSGAPLCSTTATASTAPGTAPIACSAGTLAATNYTFDVSATTNLTITTAPLTITVDPSTKVHGDPNPGFTVTPSGLQNGETLGDLSGSLAFLTAAGPTSGVGSWPVAAFGLSSPNYAISYAPGSLSITKATLTVTPLDDAIAPGDPIPSSFAVDISGFVAGDDASVVTGSAACSTDATAGDPSGAYTITCTIGTLSAANYDVVVGGTAVFTIGTVTLQVIVDPASKAFGDPNPAFTVTYVGFVNGDTPADLGGSLSFATAATTGSAAGAYPVAASGLTSSTYVFDYVAGTLTISPATQAISFGPLPDATYGDAPFDVSATSDSGLPVTFTASGACSIVGVTVTITGAGTCTVTAHQAGDADHDAAPDVTQSFDILADPGTGAGGGSGTPSSIDTDKDIVSPSGHVVVTATGFEPGTDVTIHLGPDGPDVTVTADADGNVEADIVIPAGAAAGPHTIEALGVDPDGDVLDLTTTVTVVTLPQTATLDRTRPTGNVDPGVTALLAAIALCLAAASFAIERRRRPSSGG